MVLAKVADEEELGLERARAFWADVGRVSLATLVRHPMVVCDVRPPRSPGADC